jgi:transcriptional regulator with XRE-family HTH domain
MDYRMPELGQNIRNARLAKNFTLEKLAKKVGTSKSYICEIEHAKSSPSFLIVYDIAEALNISLKKLF